MAVACPNSESGPWYAVRVRARYEQQVAQSLDSKGIPTLLPLYAAKSRWSDRIKKVTLPLFDGYVFCQADLAVRLPILVTPGVMHFVGLGKSPAPVEPHEIDSIKRIMESGSLARPWPFLKAGDPICVDEGPLRGVQGVLVRSEEGYSVVVSVSLLQRSVSVKLERDWLSPVRSWIRH
jgi:transcription antitermination factor NusG